jgi:hypothetical protein
MQRRLPSEVEAESLADLLNDVRAIPAQALANRKPAPDVVDLTAVPVQRTELTIPAATASLFEAAEHQLAGYRR